MARKTYTTQEALAIILGDSAEDIDDSEQCQSSDFEDEIDTEDEVAAAALVDLAVPTHLQPGTSGADHSQCADGASGHGQDGVSQNEGTEVPQLGCYATWICLRGCYEINKTWPEVQQTTSTAN